jgi:hypothetical protein
MRVECHSFKVLLLKINATGGAGITRYGGCILSCSCIHDTVSTICYIAADFLFYDAVK